MVDLWKSSEVRRRIRSSRAVLSAALITLASPTLVGASPTIEYGNINGVNRGTDACDPDAVFEKIKAEKLLVAPVDLRVRGIAARVPYKVEDNEKVGTHGFTRNVGSGRKFHAGTDLLGNEGEEIVAVAAGRVISVGSSSTLGNYAILRTDVVVPQLYRARSISFTRTCKVPPKQVTFWLGRLLDELVAPGIWKHRFRLICTSRFGLRPTLAGSMSGSGSRGTLWCFSGRTRLRTHRLSEKMKAAAKAIAEMKV